MNAPTLGTMNLFNDDDQEPLMIHDYMESCKDLYESSTENIGFTCVAHDALIVGMHPDYGNGGQGNLMEDVPNIRVMRESDLGKDPLLLTWKEARQLCAALWQITNLAEFG